MPARSGCKTKGREVNARMGIPLLTDIVIIFSLAIGVLLFCSRLRIPSIVGFLVTGVLAGPHGLGLIEGVHDVEILAEVGVVLLLFAIGVEFSLETLLRIRKSVLLGGSLQVCLTVVAALVLARQTGRPFGPSLFIGFLVSLSSTAIVLKLLQERAEVDTPHGRTSLAVLIFQDMIVVPMMLVTPLLAGSMGVTGGAPLMLLAKGLGIIVLVVLSARWVVPRLLYQVARTRSRELFLLSVVVLCFAIAWLTSSVGLSLALGAFLAGLILSESEYSYQALGDILPFRDVFVSFFFVSIGMLLDLGFLFRNPGVILLTVLVVLLLKTFTAGFSTMLLGFPLRTAILTGLGLSQVGEFSFLLAQTGLDHQLLDTDTYQIFLDVSVLTMAVTPFLISAAPRIADGVTRMPLPAFLKAGHHPLAGPREEAQKDHLVVIGFGVNGRNLTRAAQVAGIPHVIIEMNPETVRRERAGGRPILYGDATQETVLHHAGIEASRVVVVAISDAAATRRIVEIVRRMNPKVHVIARTRFVQEVKPLYELGANEVVPEEFETSVEIFSRVLQRYLVPRDEIDRFVSEVRSDGYQILRSPTTEPLSLADLKLGLPGVEISAVRVCAGAPLDGMTLGKVGLRKRHGVSVLAIRRGEQVLSNPDADTQLLGSDVAVVLGTPDRLAAAMGLFRVSDKAEGCSEPRLDR